MDIGTLVQTKKTRSIPPFINSLFGRYRFFRLPFGLISAQDVFQRMVDETFGDLAGVNGIADDIVVYGYDSLATILAVVQRTRETGLRFNLDKCKLRCTRIPFFGHMVGAERLQPDQSEDLLHTVHGPMIHSEKPADVSWNVSVPMPLYSKPGNCSS